MCRRLRRTGRVWRLPRTVGFTLVKRILVPAVLGVSAARHLAWYLSYQVSGSSRA